MTLTKHLRHGFSACCLLIGAVHADDLIGTPSTYSVQPGETLLDVARRFDLGFAEIRAANPSVDPWLPQPDDVLLMPTQHILPAGPRSGILINLAELRLYFFPQDRSGALSFPLGIGREGGRTPVGTMRIARKATLPDWIPTASERAENPDLPKVVLAGADNPMGEYALYLSRRGYAIHGTNRPYSIGRRDSHGCIRLYPEDIAALYPRVGVGTTVTIVDQPVKAGWSDGELYLEVHPGQSGADALEAGLEPPVPQQGEIDAWLLLVAGDDAVRINWDTAHRAEAWQRGIPVQITSRGN